MLELLVFCLVSQLGTSSAWYEGRACHGIVLIPPWTLLVHVVGSEIVISTNLHGMRLVDARLVHFGRVDWHLLGCARLVWNELIVMEGRHRGVHCWRDLLVVRVKNVRRLLFLLDLQELVLNWRVWDLLTPHSGDLCPDCLQQLGCRWA